MHDIAAIGLRSFHDALTGELTDYCDVSEWLDDDGKPCRIFWRPINGVDQKYIEGFKTQVERFCAMVKIRALDARGKKIFADTPIESMMHDYDIVTIKTIAYLMCVSDPAGDDIEDDIEATAKE